MYRAVRAQSIACIAVLSLAACGGGGATTPAAKPGTVVPGNQARHVLSIPCTPDSYGYCYVIVSTVVRRYPPCSSVKSIKYEVYNSTTDLGTYNNVISDTCGEISSTWDPDEPSVVYSDPNLP